MTAYIIGSCVNWDTWTKQNKAECIDFAEGCLLDSMVYSCKRGTAFFFEHYLNSCSSGYEFIFFPYKEQENNKQYDDTWNRFYSLQQEEMEG